MSLRHRIGRRGAALLFFAVLDLVYCYALMNPPTVITEAYSWPRQLMPLGVWAALWGFCGILCLAFAFLPRDTTAFTAVAALKVTWGLLFLLGQLLGRIERGYVSAVIWLSFAAFIYLIAGGVPAGLPGRKGRLWTRS